MVKTRRDVAYSVNRIATRAMRATTKDFSSLLRIVSYLGGTKTLGVTFIKEGNKDDIGAITRLMAWEDAAYATHPDSRSHTWYCFCLGWLGAMFYSRSSKQSIVTELGFPQVEPTIISVITPP